MKIFLYLIGLGLTLALMAALIGGTAADARDMLTGWPDSFAAWVYWAGLKLCGLAGLWLVIGWPLAVLLRR